MFKTYFVTATARKGVIARFAVVLGLTVWLDVVLYTKVLWQQHMMSGNDVDQRVVLRDHHRPIPMTKTLRQLRRRVKTSESTLQRKMATFEGGQYVLLVKALRQNRSGQVHGAYLSYFLWVLVGS